MLIEDHLSVKKLNILKIPKFLILFCIILAILLIFHILNKNSFKMKKKFYYDQYETYIFDEIKQKIIENKCSSMWDNEREFLNGIIRKFRPKKMLEIGVNQGGSSIIMLNAIKDYNAKLFSIDLNSDQRVGRCVRDYFPNFLNKWKLFQGNIAIEYLETIGNNIDLAFIDSAHFEPGEIMDFLMILPFLKEKAIVIIHDIANQIIHKYARNEWAPYLIFNAIKGKKYLPSGNRILTHNIGAIILEKNQKNYFHDYFRLLGGQWQYFPKEKYIINLKKYIKKYYDEECVTMFEEAVNFNRDFVKKHPKNSLYKYNSD